jgi:hypothetical protein
VPCALEAQESAARKPDRLTEIDRGEVLDRALGIVHAIERERGMMLRRPVAVEEFSILLLEEAAIFQNDLGNVLRRGSGVDLVAEPVPNQPGQIAARPGVSPS